jgi:hypothetical protein
MKKKEELLKRQGLETGIRVSEVLKKVINIQMKENFV